VDDYITYGQFDINFTNHKLIVQISETILPGICAPVDVHGTFDASKLLKLPSRVILAVYRPLILNHLPY
jgi:hypothetical protein